MDICKETEPEYIDVNPGHQVYCHKMKEEIKGE